MQWGLQKRASSHIAPEKEMIRGVFHPRHFQTASSFAPVHWAWKPARFPTDRASCGRDAARGVLSRWKGEGEGRLTSDGLLDLLSVQKVC